ncbi:hypothetical protein [Arthrobacter sp. AET 35A]|uniref:hypothetical protein n=1 Tax=Arthrobacter sp. AET 35A TaxID=2292643 RepID=UPI00177E13B1|nr:hypothetical protein [Arthrobacter sp. AET 35A]MBE0011515.1 hypothetical protein [Arthrobacter sp. AET 35A]
MSHSPTPRSNSTPADSSRLSAYLDDHLVAAASGVKLFSTAQESWRGTKHEQTFASLTHEIAADRKELAQIISSLGYTPSKVKMVIAQVGAQLSKVNPLNLRRSDKGSGAQLELEALQSAVRGKECMWETLDALTESGSTALDSEQLRRLTDRARKQQEQLAHIMRETAPERFLSGDH